MFLTHHKVGKGSKMVNHKTQLEPAAEPAVSAAVTCTQQHLKKNKNGIGAIDPSNYIVFSSFRKKCSHANALIPPIMELVLMYSLMLRCHPVYYKAR